MKKAIRKIVSDFDGVLTDQTQEALRVRELFRQTLIQTGSHSSGSTEQLLQEVEAAVQSDPGRYGWKHLGRISAYADEDLFIRNNAVAAELDDQAQTDRTAAVGLLRALQTKGYPSFESVSHFAFNQMTEETRKNRHKPLDPEAVKTITTLLERDVELVIVSNSGTERILDILQASGLSAQDHATHPKSRFRVRGNAQKFVLTHPAPAPIRLGGRSVEIGRPVYQKILEEENPDAVIGDVLSLDLAVPASMSSNISIVLRQRPYTPSWVTDGLNQMAASESRWHTIHDFSQILDHLH